MVKIDESGISEFMKARWKEFQEGAKGFGEDVQQGFENVGESLQEGFEQIQEKFDSDDDKEEDSDDGDVSDTGTVKGDNEEDYQLRQGEPVPSTSVIDEPRQDYISEDDPTYRDFFVPVGEGTTSQTLVPPERPPVDQPEFATLPVYPGTAPMMVSPQGESPYAVAPRMLAPTAGAPQYPVMVGSGQAPNALVQGNQQGIAYPIFMPYPAGQQQYPNQQPIAVAYSAPPQQPPQQIAQPQPQKANKSFGGFFFGKNKNKNQPQSQQQQEQYAPMPAQGAVVGGPLPPRQVSNPQQYTLPPRQVSEPQQYTRPPRQVSEPQQYTLPPRQAPNPERTLPRPQLSKTQQTLIYDPKSSVRRPTSTSEHDPAPGCVIRLPGSAYPPPGSIRDSRPPPVPAPDYPQEGANHPPGGISGPKPAPVQQSLPVAAARSVFRPPPGAPAERRDGTCTPMSVTSATSQLSSMGQFGFGVGYLDIIPNMDDKFDVLIQHANEWLRGNKCFKPVGFETLKLPCDEEGQVLTENPLSEVGADTQYCSVLRMWVIPKTEEDEQEAQTVAYMCLFPKWAPQLSKSKKPAMPTPETLDDTISRFNTEFASSKALQGKVLNMETLSHLHAFHQGGCPIHLDPEACAWTERYKEDVNLLCMVRVYYIEDITATPEVVGVQDFVPECTRGSDMTSLEPFKLLVHETDKWIKKYPGLRVTNMQTVNRVSEDADDHLNSRKMMYRRRPQHPLRCSRFLRVYYTQRVDNSPEGPLMEGPSSLSYKDFVPLTEMPSRGGKKKNKMKIHKVEKTGDVMQKVVAWHCLSGQRVVSVETVPVMGNGKLTFDPEDNYSSETSKDGSAHQLMCFRVYTDGAVTSPAPADDNQVAADSDEGGPSPSGSIRSYDFAAWPHQNLPTSSYTSGNEG